MKHPSPTSRRVMLGAMLAATAFAAAPPLFAQTSPSTAPAQLVVGDVAAAKLHVYGGADFSQVTTFDDIALAAHVGVVALADGRVLIPDDRNKQLVVLKVGAGAPLIDRRVPMPIPLPTRYAWAGVDPSQAYFAITGLDSDESVKLLTIVDLKTYAAKQFRVDTGTADAELNLALGGSEPSVFLHLAERVDTFRIADLMKPETKINAILDGTLKPASTMALGKGGHSNSFSPAFNIWAGSTLRGFEMAMVGADGSLMDHKVLPWEAGERGGGRNARQRLTWDGRHVFGPLAATVAPAQWASAEVDLHWVDMAKQSVTRLPLAKGAVGRGGVSQRFAVYASIHPEGDHANLVDVDPASATFRQVTRVPLPKLASGPVAGQPTAGRESRHSAITPDGRFAFVTQGGEGKVHVIDTANKAIIHAIDTPTPVRGGGFVVAVQPALASADFSAR